MNPKRKNPSAVKKNKIERDMQKFKSNFSLSRNQNTQLIPWFSLSLLFSKELEMIEHCLT